MKVHQILTRDEIQRFTLASDLLGARSVIMTWSVIALAFAGVIVWPSIWTALIAIVLLGGQHLALAVLSHECAHRSLFRTASLNRVVGKWLCGKPIWIDVERYRVQHLAHHAHAGSDKDPDRGLADGFPVSRTSMARKVLRDLSGITGVRRVIVLFLSDVGLLAYTTADRLDRVEAMENARTGLWARARSFIVNTGPVIAVNTALGTILWSLGAGWAYALWVIAYFTTFSLFLRLRSIAEHACTDMDSPNPIEHTRTTRAALWTRLTLAPHHVNFHTEHHLLPTAPHYRLAELHRVLTTRGVFANGHLCSGYGAVWRTVVAA